MAKTFQEQLDDLVSQFVPAEKLPEAKTLLAPLNEALTRTFREYASDIEAAKGRLRKVEGIDPEEFARLETRIKELTTALDDKDVTIKELGTKYDAANVALTDTKGKLTATAKESAIRKALSDAKLRIAPEAVEEVFASIDRRVTVKPDGSFVIPSVVTSKDAAGTEIKTPIEYAVADYITKEWAVSPYAKRVLLADVNLGGGRGGIDLGAGGSKPWKDMTLDERTAAYKADPVAAQQQIAAEAAK
jgi:hypothetical protein